MWFKSYPYFGLPFTQEIIQHQHIEIVTVFIYVLIIYLFI